MDLNDKDLVEQLTETLHRAPERLPAGKDPYEQVRRGVSRRRRRRRALATAGTLVLAAGLVVAVVGVRLDGPTRESPAVLAGPAPATPGPTGDPTVPFCRRGDVQGTLQLTGSGTTAQGKLVLTAPAEPCRMLDRGMLSLGFPPISSSNKGGGAPLVLEPGREVVAGVSLSGRLCSTGGLTSASLGSPGRPGWSADDDVEVALRGGPVPCVGPQTGASKQVGVELAVSIGAFRTVEPGPRPDLPAVTPAGPVPEQACGRDPSTLSAEETATCFYRAFLEDDPAQAQLFGTGPAVADLFPDRVLEGADTWTLIGCGPPDPYGEQGCRFDTADGRLVEMRVSGSVSGVSFLG